ncbi:EamA family transporter [Leucobacter sp. UT-8R-CII-1-4]|uniref:EamA family transporter n=1 Tax=Leucobacter sp. UT-8R-CII-1-4 TaxID=3040075 RepID=UPI0024A8BACD|nr:EamA family transporter [Leucobacter sp. UT-8R-CII-1-4]MDI6023448.1 EamA family transporter [Leucobacter sp. UT-8R-CII-1-4]
MTATPEPAASPAPSAKKGMSQGIALALAASLSNQAGAATGALAFSAIGPVGVVVIRQVITAIVMLPLGRPKLRRMTWSQWWPVICLGIVLGVMNMTVYATIDRLGLGLAITLEFLGPLAIAILASRRLIDVLCGVLAGVGVVVLVNPSPSTDFIGVGIGLISAVAWACYVLLNRKIGQRLPGFEGSAAASLVSVVMWIPIAFFWFSAHPPTLLPVILAVVCALLSSVVPLSIDMLALRRLSPGLFSTLASMHPVWAAIVGLLVLHQMLSLQEWLGIALVVVSNVLVTATNLRRA